MRSSSSCPPCQRQLGIRTCNKGHGPSIQQMRCSNSWRVLLRTLQGCRISIKGLRRWILSTLCSDSSQERRHRRPEHRTCQEQLGRYRTCNARAVHQTSQVLWRVSRRPGCRTSKTKWPRYGRSTAKWASVGVQMSLRLWQGDRVEVSRRLTRSNRRWQHRSSMMPLNAVLVPRALHQRSRRPLRHLRNRRCRDSCKEQQRCREVRAWLQRSRRLHRVLKIKHSRACSKRSQGCSRVQAWHLRLRRPLKRRWKALKHVRYRLQAVFNQQAPSPQALQEQRMLRGRGFCKACCRQRVACSKERGT